MLDPMIIIPVSLGAAFVVMVIGMRFYQGNPNRWMIRAVLPVAMPAFLALVWVLWKGDV